MELDGSYRDAEFEDENDRVEYDGDLRILYNISRTLSAFVGYRHTVLEFDQDVDEDYKIYQPTVGMEKRFDENARISIGLGYYIQDFDESDDDSGFIADAELYKKWEFRTSFVDVLGTSGYTIDDAGVDDNGLRIYYDVKVGYGYQFTPRLSSTLYGYYRYDEYPNEEPERSDNTFRAGAGIQWQMLQWLQTSLNYNYTTVTSDRDSQEYTENSVLFIITIVPSSPFRLN